MHAINTMHYLVVNKGRKKTPVLIELVFYLAEPGNK